MGLPGCLSAAGGFSHGNAERGDGQHERCSFWKPLVFSPLAFCCLHDEKRNYEDSAHESLESPDREPTILSNLASMGSPPSTVLAWKVCGLSRSALTHIFWIRLCAHASSPGVFKQRGGVRSTGYLPGTLAHSSECRAARVLSSSAQKMLVPPIHPLPASLSGSNTVSEPSLVVQPPHLANPGKDTMPH